MIKNGIIALLLIVLLNRVPGYWAVDGFRRFLVNAGLFICTFYILCDGEVILKSAIRKLVRNIRNARNKRR